MSQEKMAMRRSKGTTDIKDTDFAGVVAQLKFDVEEADVVVNGRKDPAHKAIVRKIPGDLPGTFEQIVLDVPSMDYKLVRHDEVMVPLMEKLQSGGWSFRRVRIERHGVRAYVEAVNPTKPITIVVGGKDDVLYPRLVMANSYNRSKSLTLRFGLFRMLCSNGLVAMVFGEDIKVRHIGDIQASVESFQKTSGRIDELMPYLERSAKMFNEWAAFSVNEKQVTEIAEKVVGKNNVDRIVALFQNEGKTAWGLYNAITYYLTHDYRGNFEGMDYKNRLASEKIAALVFTSVV